MVPAPKTYHANVAPAPHPDKARLPQIRAASPAAALSPGGPHPSYARPPPLFETDEVDDLDATGRFCEPPKWTKWTLLTGSAAQMVERLVISRQEDVTRPMGALENQGDDDDDDDEGAEADRGVAVHG